MTTVVVLVMVLAVAFAYSSQRDYRYDVLQAEVSHLKEVVSNIHAELDKFRKQQDEMCQDVCESRNRRQPTDRKNPIKIDGTHSLGKKNEDIGLLPRRKRAFASKYEKGDSGLRGPKGDNGATGIVGPKGDSGKPGTKGQKGQPGVSGNTGPTGQKGDRGASEKVNESDDSESSESKSELEWKDDNTTDDPDFNPEDYDKMVCDESDLD
ncbi:collagen alpha-1(XXV) chain-like [Ylistrum balloti]|uniref:collagen alpha-1(XXV) chain-like n=1 Tax=Ylistrum balloti TaxID=509963 RepID=UPI0029058209|nr:collagen alpha-1(XXV) chain-like [Ylistrum balloti]